MNMSKQNKLGGGPIYAIVLPENDALQVEGIFDNPCGWDANPKHVLLSWQIRWLCDTLQIA